MNEEFCLVTNHYYTEQGLPFCVCYILTEGVFLIVVYSTSGLCSKSPIFLRYITRRLIAVACNIHQTRNLVQWISAFRKSSLSALTNERLIFLKSNISLSYVVVVYCLAM